LYYSGGKELHLQFIPGKQRVISGSRHCCRVPVGTRLWFGCFRWRRATCSSALLLKGYL